MNLSGFFNPKSYLAKGLFAVFAFSVFFLATAFFLNHKTPEERFVEKLEKTVPLTNEQKTLVSQKLQELSRDSDSDGLKDWEEIIYRTDSQNADTDGDGTKDGEEIKQNRNPLVKGPKDSNITPAGQTAPENNPEMENNLTYNFVQKIYSIAGPSISSGSDIDQKTLESLATEMTWANPDVILSAIPDAVKKTDLAISQKNDTESIKKYFNSLVGAYISSGSGASENDLSILKRALEEKNFGELKKLDAVIKATYEAFAKIKKIPVPAGYEDFAVNELNYLARIGYLIGNFKNAEEDPLNVLAVFQARVKILGDLVDYRQKTGKELALRGITFSPEEQGYLLLK